MLSRLLTRQEQFVLLLFGSAILVGSATLFWNISRPDTEDLSRQDPGGVGQTLPAVAPTPLIRQESIKEVAVTPSPAPAPVRGKPLVKVGITGAVRHSGSYEMPAGLRVGDLLKKAGGPSENADLRALNLVAPLIDDTTIAVPFRNGEGSARPNAAAYQR